MRIQKRLRLLNNLLVLFVPRAELTQPRIVAVLYRITARLSIPPVTTHPAIKPPPEWQNVRPRGEPARHSQQE
jgi:hypothetical protein